MQKELFERFVPSADIVYTPDVVAKRIIDFLKPSGACLDPCRGGGAFHKHLPAADYCEITEGKDFFEYHKKVDWIIGNPPYSNFTHFLSHSFAIAANVSYLVPVNKVFGSQGIMNLINEYGGIKSILVFGDARATIGLPFGFSVGNFHFQRGHQGDCKLIMGMKSIF